MTRVLVAGIGTPTFEEAERHFGPGRRTTHFAFALADAGHDVTVLWRDDDELAAGCTLAEHATSRGASFHARALPPHAYVDGRVERAVSGIAPDVVVAAGVHAAAEMARALPPRLPLWADVFGDPMAEAQAKAHADRSDASLTMFWNALARVLARGDHFSAVSGAQAHALVGQLGLAGRLVGDLAGRELVSVVPCAAEAIRSPATPWLRGSHVPDDALVALSSGSVNTWCDVETMVAGLERAMDLEPTIRFVATGGAVPGHHERGADTLTALVERSRHRGRFHVLGWIAPSKLAALYGECDLGMNVEKQVYERKLGAENRVTEWMVYGLPAVTTAQSELGRAMADRDLAFAVKPGDPDDLCRTLLYLSRDRPRLRAAGTACRQYAAKRLGYTATAHALIEWCSRPVATSPLGPGARLAWVSDPQTVSRVTEEYLASLGPFELGYRSIRWFWRRAARAWNARRAT